MKKKAHLTAMVFCGLIMTITAASDALRGVFLPQFRNTFSLTEPQAGRIIMISYVGNLLFLSVGGYLSDRLPRKRFIGGVLILWAAALASYVFTENYCLLLAAMIFSMGGSTMISTSVNIITPLLFASPAMLVSIFNFLQGIGITLSQNVGGRFAHDLKYWHAANGILLGLAVICFVLLMRLKLPDPEKKEKNGSGLRKVLKSPASIILILICGCYFIAEHGLMNWLTSYGSEHLGFTVQKSAFYLSLFFGGITVGRLIFAPLIDRIGIFRSLLIWSAAGAVLYTAGISMGKRGMLLIGISGVAFSIIYPMLVMLIGKFFDPAEAGTATGTILSIATFFDIGFNAFFGGLVEKAGYGKAITVLPVCAVLFCGLLFTLKFALRKSAEIK
ncbi:MAG: MFS transporter [Ruminococcus sp.]|nr:MFS transporter [Ruminococcus sp.]